MKQLFLFTIVCLLAGYSSFAQDIITKKDGSVIKARISEVGQTSVKYKYYSNLDGPVFTIGKSEIQMITYQNGEQDVFKTDGQNFSIPEGIMTLDRRTGKVSINGMNIDKQSTYLYFTPEANEMYQSGNTISNVGDILIGTGIGFAAGYFLGSVLSGKDQNGGVYAVCAGLVAIGLPLHISGLHKIENAIADYNAKHGYAHYKPEFSFGAQQHGLGLALNF